MSLILKFSFEKIHSQVTIYKGQEVGSLHALHPVFSLEYSVHNSS